MEQEDDRREPRLTVPLALVFVVLAAGAAVGACGDDTSDGSGGETAEGGGQTGGESGEGGAVA